LPYLCSPIKKQILITYILFSDLTSIWVWGCFLLYPIILCKYSYFSHCQNAVIACTAFLILLLVNNYLVYMIKALTKCYYLLLFPVCLAVYIFFQAYIFNMNQIILLFLSGVLLVVVIVILNKLLRRNLYKELNEFAF
jgi:hypothetical protein